MKPELLPYVVAFIAALVFCIGRLAFRGMFGTRAANVLAAMAAGLVYYASYLYQDCLLERLRAPGGLVPAALAVILILLAVATSLARRPQSQNPSQPLPQRPASQLPGQNPPGHPQGTQEPRPPDRPERRRRHSDHDDNYSDDERSER